MSTSSFNRPGAIDLSGLAAKAKASQAGRPGGPGASGAAGGGGASGRGTYVVEATEQSFETEAIRKSLIHPVVVELYSPRVKTGQQLSDALIEIANASEGKFLLVRLNVDSAPSIVQALQLQAVPTVIALIGGQLAPLFQGVLAKAEVQQAIDSVIKAAVASGLVGRAEPVAGTGPDPDGPAEDEEPVADPRFAAADEALERGDFAAAVTEFEKLLQADPNDTEAKLGKAQAGLLARTVALDPAAAIAAGDAAGASLEARLAAADVEVVLGTPEAAFARLIAVIRGTAGADRDTVRTRLLELFETVGPNDPRVLKARRDLMAALF
ncbi:tetratricopeptide repeat protein [Microlunatus ginsengisoli]|uniref:Tetratricopeptide repeat protein n=1 Tax=Microlunatus ginsengisoli TaxID=363863 RepID=A0ABP7AE82_9ACTN